MKFYWQILYIFLFLQLIYVSIRKRTRKDVFYAFQIKSVFTPKIMTIIIFCIYAISVLIAAPSYSVNRLGFKFSPQRNKSVLGIVFVGTRENVEKISVAINNVSVPLVAFTIIVVCTMTLSLGLRRATKWRKQSAQASADKISSRNQKVANMVVMISTLYICCFIPVNILTVLFAYEPDISLGGKYFSLTIILSSFGLILESINSSVNIFIYYRMSSKYRDTLHKIFF